MSDDLELRMKQCFLEEACELLDSTEQCFLNLERRRDDPNTLDQIFRLAHNLKGSAKAVGFEFLGDFTHDLETFLISLKNGQIRIEKPVVSLLLACNDFLRAAVQALQSDFNAVVDCGTLQDQLRRYLEQAPGPEPHHGMASSAHDAETANDTPPLTPDSEINLAFDAQSSATSKAAHADETIRISLSKIDHLLNGVGELVIHQTVLAQHKMEMPSPLLRKTVDQMAKIVRDVQELSMSLRMVRTLRN